jgi:hypothetical protein
MNFRDTGCCGIKEITSLSSHKKPDEAMQAFCQMLFGVNKRKSAFERMTKSDMFLAAYLYSFYLFTAAIYDQADKTLHEAYKHPYGEDFAKFIKENKLGQVSCCRARTNHAFHPDHKVKAWIWRPSMKGLKKWWLSRPENQPEQPKPATPPAPFEAIEPAVGP